MNILLITVFVVLITLVVYLINKSGGIIDKAYKKDMDSYISMHHDPDRGRHQK